MDNTNFMTPTFVNENICCYPTYTKKRVKNHTFQPSILKYPLGGFPPVEDFTVVSDIKHGKVKARLRKNIACDHCCLAIVCAGGMI